MSSSHKEGKSHSKLKLVTNWCNTICITLKDLRDFIIISWAMTNAGKNGSTIEKNAITCPYKLYSWKLILDKELFSLWSADEYVYSYNLLVTVVPWENSLFKIEKVASIRHVNNIPTMQLFNRISRNSQSKSYIYAIIDWVCVGIPK